MAAKKRPVARKKRSLFRELMSGVEAMRDHREGRLTLKTREVQPITVPPINADVVRETREALKMSRHVFAFKIGVNPRTLERWEQGRSKPNEQAAALIWLVRKYPDTLKRLESLLAQNRQDWVASDHTNSEKWLRRLRKVRTCLAMRSPIVLAMFQRTLSLASRRRPGPASRSVPQLS